MMLMMKKVLLIIFCKMKNSKKSRKSRDLRENKNKYNFFKNIREIFIYELKFNL